MGRAALNVLYNRILNGENIVGLDDAKQTLADMGLLSKSADGDEIKESEKTNIPRFLNRLLSLEVDRQNALFDYFYQTFLETIEHLKAKGKIDDGMEDLKAVSVKIAEPPQILHTDALTGAQTIYYKLDTTVPTRPALFDEISVYDGVYFYEHRQTGTFVAVRATLPHTDPETGDRYQMFSISRPAGYNLFYIKESELASRYKIVTKTKARNWWKEEESKIPLRRVGSNSEKKIDARIIAATSQNLKQMVVEGRFRADLYDRLNILNLETVPLRHQKEKIKHLLLERLNAEQFAVGRAAMFEISGDAVRVLEDYDWRGNFRELINFATRLVVECFDDAVITAKNVRKVLQREQGGRTVAEFNSAEQSDAGSGAGKTFDEFSITSNLVTVTFDLESDDLDTVYLKAAGSVIRHVVFEQNGNLRSAAQAFGVNHSTISRILEKFNRTYDQKPFHTRRKRANTRSATVAA